MSSNKGALILARLARVLAIVVMTGVTAAVTAAGCASRGSRVEITVPPLLTWLGEHTRAAGTSYPQLSGGGRFGSLSGLVHDAASNQWVAVIDDREDTRVAWIDIRFGGGGLDVAPVRVQTLRPGPNVAARVVTQADLEAITALPDGTFVLAEEGHIRDGEVWQPALLRMTREGVVTDVIGFPPALRITGDEVTGLRDNQGVESLTRTPSGSLIAGIEQPLWQDGTVTFDRGAPVWLVEFVPAGSSFKPGRQWTYMLSPTPRADGFDATCDDGENGLVELLALSDTRLIALERACLRDTARQRVANPVRLFFVELIGATARKELLLDLNEIAHRLPPEMSRLDNFEGLAFGPIVNGARSLLVMSDDNYRPTQRTSFLLLGMHY